LGKKGLTLLAVVAGGLAAAVYWPAKVEEHFPGWIERTASVRARIPGADANVPSKTASEKPAQGRPVAIQRPPVPVDIDTVQRGPMPLRIDAVGTAQPINTTSIRTRIDAQIDKIFVADGARVKPGEVLVKLDSRQIEAQIKQTEATIAKDQTVIEQTTRDLARATELFGKNSGTQLNVDNAKTAGASARATLAADQALLENLRVQLSWYTLSAPIGGRVGAFSSKAGNIVRSGDNTSTGILGTIVQTSPIYVAFSVPQVVLASLREAVDRGEGEVRATPQGGERAAVGKIAVLDNTIDSTTGTINIRAVFDNANDVLWPGQLCTVRVTLKTEQDVVSIARSATQSGQIGNFVYVIEDGVAKLRRVKVGRFQDGRDIILEGLQGGETIVSDGALLLAEGSRVDIRNKPQAKKEGI
jgi:multidrug efflux system membrane fusion protein